MDSSLRAVTVETPSVQEQEYIDDDAIKRLSTSRGRRSVTFADASTQGGFEDQRVNNAMQLEEKTVDDHDEKQKSKRNAMNTMSSFTRRALGSRASMVEITTGGERGGEEEEDLKREKKEREHQKLSSSSSYYSQSHFSSWRTFRRRGKEVCRKILDNKCTSIFMTLATIWALFGDDVRVLAFPMEYDEIFVGVAIALIVLFALETTMSCFAKGKKYVLWFLLLVGRRRVFVSVYGRARVHGIRRHGSVRRNGFVRHRFGRRSVRREIRDEIGEFW